MIEAKICRWYGGKQAALSLRFDDSHPTHVENAVPILNTYGLVGTFMINPGRQNHKNFLDAWEGSILAQGHELANHTVHHKGALNDRDAEAEIGGCSAYIWGVQKRKSKLLAFARGGGTTWMPRKPMAFFCDKYALFRTDNSMSCSEVYEHFSVDGFRARLDQAIIQGEWLQTHFHCVGEGYLNISIPTFQQLLDCVKHDLVWSAGMSSIYQYETARNGALLQVQANGNDALSLRLTCTTPQDLYAHPLTLSVTVTGGDIAVLDGDGQPILHRAVNGAILFDVPPVDGIFAIQASGLGTAYREAHSDILSDPGAHPFLFFKADDIAALRIKTTRLRACDQWDRVKREADELIGPNAPSLPNGIPTWLEARVSTGRLRPLGLAYAMTGEVAYANRAVREIETALRSQSWTHEEIKDDADLVSAEITCNLALGYDWINDYLSDDLKRQMRSAIVQRGLLPIVSATERRVWWTHWYRCNWGSVIYGQAGVAALCLLGEEPRAADWVRLCQAKIWGYGRALGEDGSWGESVSYGCYAWFNGTLFMDALHRVTGGQVDLFDNPRLQNLSMWFTQLLVPDESGFVPFSNCGKGTGFTGQFLYRLAKAYGDGHAQWIADRMLGRGTAPSTFGFLWCDPELAEISPTDLPRSEVFNTDWAVLRSGWEDPDATLFALKGGQKEWDHYHHDTNHFVLYAYHEPLIVDLFYPHKIWGCETEAHNTILVNDKDQRGKVRVQGCRGEPDHRGVVDDLMDAGWYARVIADGSLAYDPEDVNGFVREVLYLRHLGGGSPTDYLVMFDDVDATGPMPMDWLLHTYGALSVNGNRATLTQGAAAAEVVFVSPKSFRCHVVEKNVAEDTGAPIAFDGAETLRYLKLRPEHESSRGVFVTVIAPRKANEKTSLTAEAICTDNTSGVRVTRNDGVDRALFALNAPEIHAEGIRAEGSTCFVRRVGDQIMGAALHNGQRLEVDGQVLVETDGFGHAVLKVDAHVTEVVVDLIGSSTVRFYVDHRPLRVVVDGHEQPFEYDVDSRCVAMSAGRGRQVVRAEG